jgi:hypothetical protein
VAESQLLWAAAEKRTREAVRVKSKLPWGPPGAAEARSVEHLPRTARGSEQSQLRREIRGQAAGHSPGLSESLGTHTMQGAPQGLNRNCRSSWFPAGLGLALVPLPLVVPHSSLLGWECLPCTVVTCF